MRRFIIVETYSKSYPVLHARFPLYIIYRILNTGVYPTRYTTCVSKLEMCFGYYIWTSYVKQPTTGDFAAFRIGDVQLNLSIRSDCGWSRTKSDTSSEDPHIFMISRHDWSLQFSVLYEEDTKANKAAIDTKFTAKIRKKKSYARRNGSRSREVISWYGGIIVY